MLYQMLYQIISNSMSLQREMRNIDVYYNVEDSGLLCFWLVRLPQVSLKTQFLRSKKTGTSIHLLPPNIHITQFDGYWLY